MTIAYIFYYKPHFFLFHVSPSLKLNVFVYLCHRLSSFFSFPPLVHKEEEDGGGGSGVGSKLGLPHNLLSNQDNFFCLFLFLFFCFFRATPVAYGGSRARGQIGAAPAGLHHSHSNLGSESCLPPAPQLTATRDP